MLHTAADCADHTISLYDDVTATPREGSTISMLPHIGEISLYRRLYYMDKLDKLR